MSRTQAQRPVHQTRRGLAALHLEVRRLATDTGRRRSAPALVHIGWLPGERVTLPLTEDLDQPLAADLLTRVLDTLPDRPRDPACWLSRHGHLSIGDAELLWLAAAAEAWGRHGYFAPDCYLVTRHGWIELRDGESLTWERVRHLQA